jgi:hypothetical protein
MEALMFVHCVYFWLKEDLAFDDMARFEAGLQSLVDIGSVRSGWYGTPAATDRPVIDRSYSYGLVVVFDDEAGHDAYQVDPSHDAFRQRFSPLWNDVRIYDFLGGTQSG